VDLGGILVAGAGISFWHAFAVRPSLEAPTKGQNTYVRIPAQTFVDGQGVTHTIGPKEGFLASVSQDTGITYQDSGSFVRNLYPQIRRSETHFPYQGTKLMGRIAFDPKPLFGRPDLLGKEDLKLYSEIAVLGWEDYPFLYDKRGQRTPVMVGFNIPCFKLLDVLGVEAEYFGDRFPNDWEKSVRDGIPQPGSTNGTFDGEAQYEDDWKWSIYLRKQVSKGLYVSAQAASDHLRLANKDGYTYESLMKKTGWPFTGQWWGIFRVTASY
jgi:hypothetical protein